MSACPYVAYERSANRLQIVLGGKAVRKNGIFNLQNLAYASVILDSRQGFVEFQLQMVDDQIRDLDMALRMALMIVGQSNDFVVISFLGSRRFFLSVTESDGRFAIFERREQRCSQGDGRASRQ